MNRTKDEIVNVDLSSDYRSFCNWHSSNDVCRKIPYTSLKKLIVIVKYKINISNEWYNVKQRRKKERDAIYRDMLTSGHTHMLLTFRVRVASAKNFFTNI